MTALYQKLMTCRRCQIVFIAFLALVAIGLAVYFLGGGNALASMLGSGKLFEAFWMTVGREESWNRLDDWKDDDAGSGTSLGWIHFNQRFSIHKLFEAAQRDDPGQFRSVFGGYADSLADSSWVKSANLNEPNLKETIRQWLKTPWGEKIQKQVAKNDYFDPTMAAFAELRPGADDVYRVVAASTRVWTNLNNVRRGIEQNATVEGFSEQLRTAKGDHEWANIRFRRQLANAKSTVAGEGLAIT